MKLRPPKASTSRPQPASARGRELDHRRGEEALAAAALPALGGEQAVEGDPLVSGVLVNDHELTQALAEHVGAGELPEDPQVREAGHGQQTPVDRRGQRRSAARRRSDRQ
jgi:hypothetical protein